MTATIGSKIGQRRRIGRGPVQVTGLGLGTAPLGGLYRDLSDEEAHATIAAAWDVGVRYFDTAPHYGNTKAEHRLGDALAALSARRLCAVHQSGPPFRAAHHAFRRQAKAGKTRCPFEAIYDYTHDGILRSFEDSQQRLGIVEIDILLVHDIGRCHARRQPSRITGGN